MKCTKCGDEILPGEYYFYCKEHKGFCFCEKCADRVQRACPYDKDPLSLNTV